MGEYNEKAVQQGIDADPSIGTTEAALIHRLLKGRRTLRAQTAAVHDRIERMHELIQDAADTDPGEQHEPAQLTWRVEVRLIGEMAWTRNGVVFNTAAEAEAEGERIARAWSAVAETRIRAAGYREE
jgi:hypothetical protein